ncbi:MAG: alanine--tRNA ligase [Thermomicrobiales bacterium]|nr:alanine--tRNA ligase [Thermomicrobiales bacterium]MCO5227227.1 alanine--tRNA ligase [Thermomicrobiales bacterium]
MSTQVNEFGMPWMSGFDIRQRFVEFFESKQHLHVASSSLVPPAGDTSVLLTTAGMQQMIPYFLGLETPPAVRMCTVQKCFRTVDIDEVGDESHSTFFFMLGNFSVRDYFKHESLAWTWEFLTEWMHFPAERLYPTIHPDDEESFLIWRDEVGVPEERIGRLEDNWWQAGPTGPNGPDSEVYFDRGEQWGCGSDDCAPGCDCPRYLEVWNNVFMQYNTTADGVRTPLAKPCVDTGMGLERLVLLTQGARTMYETDFYQPIVRRICERAGVSYGVDPSIDRSVRIVADHTRGSVFLIGDGVLPGNEGRSYVLRRVMRKAIRHARSLGIEGEFIAELASVVIDQFADVHPELVERRSQITKVMSYEEASFGRTLASGMNRLQALTAELKERGETLISGEEAFRLYDTYGFPYDLTVELALEEGLSVDDAGYRAAMERQRETSRSGAVFNTGDRNWGEFYAAIQPRTTFLGYETTTADATIVAILGANGTQEQAEAGEQIELVLDRTPFYAESGGQVGDSGKIHAETGLFDVDDTRKPTPDLFVHRGTVQEGFIRVGESVTARVDSYRRSQIRRNHTATHLLHKALRTVVGEDSRQAGSLVAPDRLRFDFTSLEPVSAGQIRTINEIVNREIVADRAVATDVMEQKEAIAAGAMALFGEKYGDQVRVVKIDDISMELCGGTHVSRTGEIGPFIITSEGSVASGIRRIEALTGHAATERMLGQQRLLDEMGRDLKVSWSEVSESVHGLQDRVRELEREVEGYRERIAKAQSAELLGVAARVNGATVLVTLVDVDDRDALRTMGDYARDRIESGVIVLGANIDGSPALLAMVTPDLVGRGVKAGDIIRYIAPKIDGRGGGRPELAEAGGKNVDGLSDALREVAPFLEGKLEG